jgi:hypothetical protein
MQKENQNQVESSRDVMTAVAQFVEEITLQGNLQDLPSEMQEITELLLVTEQANDLHVRSKMLRCLNTIRALAKAIEPFTYEEIITACNPEFNV